MKVKIKKAAMEDILHHCKNMHPKEFIGLLEGEKDLIEKVVILPGQVYGMWYSSFDRLFLPLGIPTLGVIHSHPSGNGKYSETDLRTFAKAGRIHIIVANPYKLENIFVYDSSGRKLELEVL